MRNSRSVPLFNIDPETLDLVIGEEKLSPMAVPSSWDHMHERMPPMWELVYFEYMYADYYRSQMKAAQGKTIRACLAPPPAWLVAIAAVMWEGILQGASWELVKNGVRSAVSKLQIAGIAPTVFDATTSALSLTVGWREVSNSSKKQYEMFLSLKRSYKRLPDRHAVAYARAANGAEFGKIIRGQLDVPLPKPEGRPRSQKAHPGGKSKTKRQQD